MSNTIQKQAKRVREILNKHFEKKLRAAWYNHNRKEYDAQTELRNAIFSLLDYCEELAQ